MTDIFLSYNREDQVRAKLFADAFAAHGFKVWWDVGLRTGEAYDEVTETALRTARAVVVLWSRKSVQSRWVRAEATLAERNKTFVPCMIEPCERPIMFELTQTAELSHWAGEPQDAAWQAFLADVTRFVGAPPRPATAPPPPAETIRAVARPPVLAVLAFENLSADAELQYFSDGVAEEILAAMSRAPDIRVIGSTSTFAFRGERKRDAAGALGASHVLDGSVRRQPGAHFRDPDRGRIRPGAVDRAFRPPARRCAGGAGRDRRADRRGAADPPASARAGRSGRSAGL